MRLKSLLLKSMLVSGLAFALPAVFTTAAEAEPNITGMWSVSQPEGQTHQAQGKFTPAAAARNAEDRKITDANHRLIGEAHTKCWPTGMPGLMQPPFGIEFLQTKGRITVLSEVSNLPRTIYLDEKAHPATLIPGWNGHSIGHWDKDVLYVDTIGFNGRNHNVSDKTHITEKIYLDKDGYLVDELTQEDPMTYAEPHKVSYRYKRAEGQEASEVMEYVCEVDPANLFAFEQEQKAAGRPSAFDSAWSAYGVSHPAAPEPQKQAAK